MKICRVAIVTLSISALLSPVLALAGALDRGPMQQRYNPAAEEMIRIPGVIGMYEQDALAVLQQAGVAPEIKYDKRYKEDLDGKEGTVIDQEPGAAGVSMLGSIVTITVYWPASMGQEPSGGNYGGQYGDGGDGGQWGEPAGGASSPEYQEPAPQWGGDGGQQPAGDAGWTPPPAAPASQPTMAPQPAAPIVPVGPAPVVKPRIPSGVAAPAVPVKATPVPQTVTPVTPRAPAPAKAPVQQQLDEKVPARVDIRNKMKGADRKLVPSKGVSTSGGGIQVQPVNPTVTPVSQQPPAPTPIVMTPVQQTVTPVQPTAPATFTATPVQQTVTPVNQSMTVAEEPTYDGSCRSWYAIAVDITAEAQRIAKELGCSWVQPPAMWKQCIKHIDKIGKWNAYNFQLKKRWNRLVKKTSWAAIGPRELTFGKTHNGRIIGTTGRMFITPVPINKGHVNIKINKEAGKSRTGVTVCSYMPGGDRIKEWQFESPKGNKNKGQVWIKDLSNMDGKLLSIHLDGKSAADTFKYSIFLENN